MMYYLESIGKKDAYDTLTPREKKDFSEVVCITKRRSHYNRRHPASGASFNEKQRFQVDGEGHDINGIKSNVISR